jgi:hypothetical protein
MSAIRSRVERPAVQRMQRLTAAGGGTRLSIGESRPTQSCSRCGLQPHNPTAQQPGPSSCRQAPQAGPRAGPTRRPFTPPDECSRLQSSHN